MTPTLGGKGTDRASLVAQLVKFCQDSAARDSSARRERLKLLCAQTQYHFPKL